MNKHYKQVQYCSQVQQPKEKSLSDYYIDYDPVHQTLKVRSNNATGDIIEQYTYDQDGQRLKKHEPQLNQTTYYLTDNFLKVVNDTGTYRTTYYYQDDVLVGRKDPDGRKYFYHPDHLGSTDLVTDENQQIVEETTYKPYGEVIDDGFSRFLHGAKELDSTGLYDYGPRLYDPFCRCFISPDKNIPDVYNSQALNRYSFVYNNPYKYVDPTGEYAWIPTALRAAFTATVNAVKTYGPTALRYFGIGAGINLAEQFSETGDVTKLDTQQAVIAGTTSAVTGTTGNVLVSTQGNLLLSKSGKEIGNLLISQYSGQVAGNVARNMFEGRPALENSGNVDPDTFIKNLVFGAAFGTSLPSSTRLQSNIGSSQESNIDLSIKKKSTENDASQTKPQSQTKTPKQGGKIGKKKPQRQLGRGRTRR